MVVGGIFYTTPRPGSLIHECLDGVGDTAGNHMSQRQVAHQQQYGAC